MSETVNERIERELRLAVADVIGQFEDKVLRTFDVQGRSNKMEWEINVHYTLPWGGYQPVPSLIIDDAYPVVPDHQLLRSKIRAHLLANPPNLVH
jgi:hypothetical protein